jgi:hypothetical protein
LRAGHLDVASKIQHTIIKNVCWHRHYVFLVLRCYTRPPLPVILPFHHVIHHFPLLISIFYVDIYRARIARAAAPRRPAAWVAWAAPPVNWLTLELAAAAPLEAALPAAEVTDARALETLLAADSTAELAAEAAELAAEAAELALLAAAEVADSTALEAAPPAEDAALAAAEVADATADEALGISMGTPACLQVDSTAEMVVAWSSALQAPWTQGWTDDSSFAPCLQWQAKSVRPEQPSEVRGPMKQFNWSVSVG